MSRSTTSLVRSPFSPLSLLTRYRLASFPKSTKIIYWSAVPPHPQTSWRNMKYGISWLQHLESWVLWAAGKRFDSLKVGRGVAGKVWEDVKSEMGLHDMEGRMGTKSRASCRGNADEGHVTSLHSSSPPLVRDCPWI
jgi:hypothetical protein